MAKVAAGHLYVTTKSGEVHHFSPGDPLPSWAQRVIKNPAAITDDGKNAGRAAEADTPQGEPSEKWKVDELKAYAAEQGVDITGSSSKADILAALAAAADGGDAQGAEDAEPEVPEADSPQDIDEPEADDEDDEMSPAFDPKA